MNPVRAFFPISGHLSLNFKKGQGRPSPLPPSSYAPESSIIKTLQKSKTHTIKSVITTFN